MKLVNFQCEQCGKNFEEIYDNSEEIPEVLKTCECGGEVKKFNYKINSHRVHIMDK